MNLENKTNQVWDNAEDCDCDDQGCYTNHKLCGICGGTMLYTAHESNQPNSEFAWNIDHIRPKYFGIVNNEIDNLQATHVECNQNKGNAYF